MKTASTPMPSGIDWDKKRKPWRTIGPAFREDCLDILKQPLPPRTALSERQHQAIGRKLGISLKAGRPEQA